MTVGSNLLHFTYDASGTPMAVLYNGTTYYYATNIQGDVIAILNADGTAVVEYAYDAWGNLISTTGSMATTLGVTNPLRYRGYVFDSEYGFYYLQSRYYNPKVGRFLNGDAFASTGQGILGNNMFAYCQGNPINFQDTAGTRMVHADPYRGGPLPDGEQKSEEQKVLEAEYFAMYKGVPVVKLPIGTDAFSLGIMFLGDDLEDRSDPIETVQHEYGHAVHCRMVGVRSYFVNAFIPSLAGYWLGDENYDANYYSHVYEYTADILGGVNRSNYSYAAATEAWWGVYLLYTILYP